MLIPFAVRTWERSSRYALLLCFIARQSPLPRLKTTRNARRKTPTFLSLAVSTMPIWFRQLFLLILRWIGLQTSLSRWEVPYSSSYRRIAPSMSKVAYMFLLLFILVRACFYPFLPPPTAIWQPHRHDAIQRSDSGEAQSGRFSRRNLFPSL